MTMNAFKKVLKCISSLNDTKSNKEETKAYIKSTVGYVGKNLLKITGLSAKIHTSMFTVNADGSVHVKTDSATPETAVFFLNKNIVLSPGRYILSGGDEKNLGQLRLYISKKGSTEPIQVNTNELFEINEGDIIESVRIYVYSNHVDDIMYYPMIRCADITSSDFKPYQQNLQEQIDERPILKSATYTGMTSENGNLTLEGYLVTKHIIISAVSSTASFVLIPFKIGTSTFGLKCINSISNEPLNSINITATIYYYDLN